MGSPHGHSWGLAGISLRAEECPAAAGKRQEMGLSKPMVSGVPSVVVKKSPSVSLRTRRNGEIRSVVVDNRWQRQCEFRPDALLCFGSLRLEQITRLARQPFVECTEGAGIRFPIDIESWTVGFV